jgi:Spx/MgsR family transcriptional regulator
MIQMYGIPNCDTVKKAQQWLRAQGLAFAFHDFRKQGVPAQALQQWLQEPGWEAVLNRKGTTWRQLPPEVQAGVTDAASAQALLLAHPSAIKRPVVAWPDGRVTVGFSPEGWAALAL